MSDPFLAEIRMVSFNFPPKGWAFCNGQVLPINQNQALFSLLGTTYGGDGRTTFALPNLQGRLPLHTGTLRAGGNFVLGQRAGEEAHTLIVSEMPAHTHPAVASSNPADQTSPANNYWAVSQSYTAYAPSPNETMAPNAVGLAGGSQPVPNLSPYLVLNFVIAIVGIYPSRD
jgi:microcystin-dependent protein